TPGSRLGHFEIIGTVGAGGMAAVLKARDLELNRVVALKILPPAMARDAENVARFKQEARAAARLDHDHIARVFFCGEDQGLHFIAFEYVEGDNFRQIIDRRKTVPAGECVRYMIQAAAGLGHAAARGVVHRDVKPSNLVISPDGKVKIVDMGLARSLHGQTVNGGVTQSGVTLGTFDYISPEQALDPRRADVRSDIYSLGCAFYHALTGRPPVPEGTAAKKLYAHQNEPVTDPRVLNPSVPDELAAVLARMMAKDPARRYQTPAELIADLTAVAGRLNVTLDGVPADVPGGPVSAAFGGRSFGEPPRIPRGLVAGIAGLVVAADVLAGGTTAPRAAVAPPWEEAAAKPAGPDAIPPQIPGSTVPRAPDPVAHPADAAALAAALREPAVGEIRLERNTTYDLTPFARGVVVGDGRRVTVVGVVGPDAPVIRTAAGPATGDRPGSLTIRGADDVRFEGVRFEVVVAAGSEDLPDETVGVAVADTSRVEFAGCRFDAEANSRAPSVVGLAVTRDPGKPATILTVTHGFFAVRKGVGVRLTGRVRAEFAECGFAPHLAGLELIGDPEAAAGAGSVLADMPGGDVRFTHCTFLLDQKAAAVRAEDGGRWLIRTGLSVFAAVPPPADPTDMGMMTDPPERRPAVLRVAAERSDFDAKLLGRAGEPNAYFRVDALAVGTRGYTLDDCRLQWATPPVADADAVPLVQSPWATADPVAELAGREPWRALRLRTTLRAVQVPGPDHRLVGVRFKPDLRNHGPIRFYDTWPPAAQAEPSANPREKVWYPNPPADERGRLGRNQFDTLSAAVESLRPDDVLLIRHDGPLPVPPGGFDKPRLRATVRPYPGTRPVLTPGVTVKIDAGLFRIGDGDLTLDGLELRLRPRADVPAAKSLAAVVVTGGGRCVLRDCVVTFDDPGMAEKLAAVTVADPDPDGRTTTRRPVVAIENCLLRGSGRGVWVPAARPFDLTIENTVAALAGPLVGVGPSARPIAAGGATRVALSRVTAALAGPVLDLRAAAPGSADTARGWVFVETTASRCVFAGVGRPGPVVVVSGTAANPDADRYLTWRPGTAG
ncbi:MAG: serine/threonine-protein kinase, partial [Fimbriiglobus sp.]